MSPFILRQLEIDIRKGWKIRVCVFLKECSLFWHNLNTFCHVVCWHFVFTQHTSKDPNQAVQISYHTMISPDSSWFSFVFCYGHLWILGCPDWLVGCPDVSCCLFVLREVLNPTRRAFLVYLSACTLEKTNKQTNKSKVRQQIYEWSLQEKKISINKK